MSDQAAPASVAELVEVVRSYPKLLAVGAGTKPRLSAVDVAKVSTLRLRGMVEYEPSEFTFTAMAGTRVREVVETLARRGQYLPLDPMLVDTGATLGGTVAAGLSGPGRLRFGGLKDFILGVQFVDGRGRALRMGGKVVKNAAGFDLPKFFVGSLGRFGVLAELTFKVFPTPASTLTLKLTASDVETSARILMEAARARWEPHALEVLPGACDVCVRLGGPAQALDEMANDILAGYPGEKLTEAAAQAIWSDLREFGWVYSQGLLVKIVLTPKILPSFAHALEPIEGVRIHISGGGNMAFVSLSGAEQAPLLNQVLRNLSLSGMTLSGKAPLWCGTQSRHEIAQAVKSALDPGNRFPGLSE